MFTLGIPGLIAGYILTGILLLYLNLYSIWSWKLKAGSVIVTSFFYIILYFSFPLILGLPSEENPPVNFRILGSHIQRPSESGGNDGAIYLWLAEIDPNHEIIEPPRAYKMPYSIGFHEKVMAIQVKLDKGIKQLGKLDDESNAPPTEQNDKKQSSSISSKLNFYDLPEIQTTTKE